MSDANVYEAAAEMIPPLPDQPVTVAPPQSQQAMRGGRPVPQHGIPRFENVPKRRADGSFENVEYVSIITPGDPKASPRHKVNEFIRDRYRWYYDRWRQGLEAAPDGTPLEMWSLLSPAQVMELKALNIFTVEQLSEVADSNLHRLPMGRTLKNQATAWLKSKKNDDQVENMRRENESLRDGMRIQEEQLNAMAAQLAEIQAKMGGDDKSDKPQPSAQKKAAK